MTDDGSKETSPAIRLRRFRVEVLDISQDALAELLAISQSTVRRIEAGSARPRLDVAERIERMTRAKHRTIGIKEWLRRGCDEDEAT